MECKQNNIIVQYDRIGIKFKISNDFFVKVCIEYRPLNQRYKLKIIIIFIFDP